MLVTNQNHLHICNTILVCTYAVMHFGVIDSKNFSVQDPLLYELQCLLFVVVCSYSWLLSPEI